MEIDQIIHNVNFNGEPEEISDSFLCCICLDLLYKPIVLSCGHISCFWCVQRSMSNRCESRCPICRHTYNHFPNFCLMLHHLLSKIYPIAYKMREKQIQVHEKKTGFFSPQFDIDGCGPLVDTEFDCMGDSTNSSTTVSDSTSKVESHQNMEQLESISVIVNDDTTITKQTAGETVSFTEKKHHENKLNSSSKLISIADVLCTVCKQLLICPVVLNCGHVYCETCIIKATDEQLTCQVCQCLNPRGFPKVCLELNHFLEEQFCEEYAARRDAVQLKKKLLKHESETVCSMETAKLDSQVPTGENIPWWQEPRPKVHIGIGCDFCGMFPIVGKRYKCKDCVEIIGFDLCGDCYNSSSKLPRRFNQQHTPEHRLELVEPNIIGDMVVRLVSAGLEDGSSALVLTDAFLENESAFTWTSQTEESDRND